MRRRSKSLLFACLVGIASVPARAEWHEARSKHFSVYADTDPADLKAYAERLERFDAAVREARGVPDVAEGAATRVTLYMVRDLKALRRLFGYQEDSVAGFYIPRASGSVAFVPERSERGEFQLNSDSIFFHEYTHHLMLQDADRPLPPWLTEGFAEFFANPEFKPDGSVVIGHPPKYRAQILFSTSYQIPLEKMLAGDFSSLMFDNTSTLYGRGWLLTHLLSFDLKRRGQLTRYLADLEAGMPGLKAAENAFGDLRALDRELHAYFKKDVFTVATIAAEKLRPPPVTIRTLPPGEAKMMAVTVPLQRGSRAMADSVARRARGIAQDHPDDPAVQTILAQAEFNAGNFEAAVRAADRALQFNDKADQAMLAKAKAMLALGKISPSTTPWDDIRALIARANRIDPENAEPLSLFYQTFTARGQAPNKNAIDGLKYAVALTPQDTRLRFQLIDQLIDRNEMPEARRYLIPLAHTPHKGKWMDKIQSLFEDVSAGRRTEARAKLHDIMKDLDD